MTPTPAAVLWNKLLCLYSKDPDMPRWDDRREARDAELIALIDAALDAARRAERERCAKIAENEPIDTYSVADHADRIAYVIRRPELAALREGGAE